MIHPKLVWIIELPWIFLLFEMPLYTVLLNFIVQTFISAAILASFKKYLESKDSHLGVLPYVGAFGITLLQAFSFVVPFLRLYWPQIRPGEPRPDWLEALVHPEPWVMAILVVYPLFMFTMYRLKERVLALDRAERKDRSAKEIRSDLSKSLKKAKEAATTKPDKPEPALTVVLHMAADGATATVWMLPALKPGTEPSDFAAVPGAEKVLGPAPKSQADEAHRALTAALTRANVPHEAFVA